MAENLASNILIISQWKFFHKLTVGAKSTHFTWFDDFFPDFSVAVVDYCDTHEELYARLQVSTYGHLVRHALRRHQILTVLHMLRNCLKYRAGVWPAMIGNAIKSRLSFF